MQKCEATYSLVAVFLALISAFGYDGVHFIQMNANDTYLELLSINPMERSKPTMHSSY